MEKAKILSQTRAGRQVTTAYQIEGRVFITESHFNPNGAELSDLLVPVIVSQQNQQHSENNIDRKN